MRIEANSFLQFSLKINTENERWTSLVFVSAVAGERMAVYSAVSLLQNDERDKNNDDERITAHNKAAASATAGPHHQPCIARRCDIDGGFSGLKAFAH